MSEENKQNIRRLKRFQLTEEEARVYIHLPHMRTINDDAVHEELDISIEDVRSIMKSLEEKGFVKMYMEGIYIYRTPIEALNRRIVVVINAILSELQELRGDLIRSLQPIFPSPSLLSCNLDRAHFNMLVGHLTKKARNSVYISTKELKFIEESDFLNVLGRNRNLGSKSVKILLTMNTETPEPGDIISRLRKLVKSHKVWIKHNSSRTEIRYLTIDKSSVLLVEADHTNAVVIESKEVAEFFDFNFESYFDTGKDIHALLDAVKHIKSPQEKDEEVREIFKTAGII